jgi:class 3 adenylate cyclase
VIGDPVNEAARLCELAKARPEQVLAARRAVEAAAGPEAGDPPLRRRDPGSRRAGV